MSGHVVLPADRRVHSFPEGHRGGGHRLPAWDGQNPYVKLHLEHHYPQMFTPFRIRNPVATCLTQEAVCERLRFWRWANQTAKETAFLFPPL